MLGACVEKKLNKGLFGSEQSVEILLYDNTVEKSWLVCTGTSSRWVMSL